MVKNQAILVENDLRLMHYINMHSPKFDLRNISEEIGMSYENISRKLLHLKLLGLVEERVTTQRVGRAHQQEKRLVLSHKGIVVLEALKPAMFADDEIVMVPVYKSVYEDILEDVKYWRGHGFPDMNIPNAVREWAKILHTMKETKETIEQALEEERERIALNFAEMQGGKVDVFQFGELFKSKEQPKGLGIAAKVMQELEKKGKMKIN